MSKVFRYILYFILFCVLLRACGTITLHDHEWQDAICTAPKTCTVYGETQGSPSRHSWVKATCKIPKPCSVCVAQDGDPLNRRDIDSREQMYRRITDITYCYIDNGEYRRFTLPMTAYKGYNDLVKRAVPEIPLLFDF